jgi:multidrug efflux pump subunit AcrA (membrane-fusion protein)
MNNHIKKIIGDIKDIAVQVKEWFFELSRWKQVITVLIGVLVLIMIGRAFGGDERENNTTMLPRAVTLATVSSLSENGGTLPLLGTVTSRSEATVRAETGGQLRVVYKKLGDYVVAGQIIAEFENAAERASVTTSEGGYEAAKAARDITRINKGTSNSSLAESKISAINTITSAYNTLDDAIRSKSDGLLSNPDNDRVELAVTVPDQVLVESIRRERINIETLLTNRVAKNKKITTESDLLNELTLIENETKQIKAYLDDMASALSKALPNGPYTQSSLDGSKISVNAARSLVSGTLSSITGARTALNNSIASNQIAAGNGVDSNPTQAGADAQVKQALGNYQAALARLEKTIVRSPISGTLNSLSVETGDYISPYTEIGVVSNNGALEVVSYVTDEDKRQLTIGSKVSIEGGATGVITKLAGALDPRTKKIEVRIGITNGASELVNGQSVRITTNRIIANTEIKKGKIEIPLAALKITPQGSYVFSVINSTSSEDTGTLVANRVTEGALLGERVQILDGVTGDMVIVTDARGLKEGGIVTIKK